MAWANQDKTAIVGVGATDYYVRGKSWPRTINDMAGEAILNACADAGISIKQIDGIAYYSGAGAGYLDKFDTASLMETLGMPHISFSASLTTGGGGCPGAIGLATAGLMNEDCTYMVTLMALQQLPQHRLGVVFGANRAQSGKQLPPAFGAGRAGAPDERARAAAHAPVRHHAGCVRRGGDGNPRQHPQPPQGGAQGRAVQGRV